MNERSFRMVDPLGLHARPASAVVKVAKPFAASLTLSAGGERANVKNLMQLLSLGIAQGTTFTVKAEGDDAEQALQAITDALQGEGLAEPA